MNDGLIASSITHHETKAMYENRGAFSPLIINFSAFYTALNHGLEVLFQIDIISLSLGHVKVEEHAALYTP